jgi:acyl-CoA synthetase (NDP forming)
MTAKAMDRLLAPKSIAIVGLSDAADKHGARVLRNLRAFGFEGDIWGVHPTLRDVQGVPVRPSLADLPGVPEVVICAVPAAAIPDVVTQAGRVGSAAAVIFSSGFAELGPDGEQAQAELVATARAAGVRLIGPNSGGVIRPAAGVAMSFLTCLDRDHDAARPGAVGVVTQSGGTGSYLYNLAAQRASGLAAIVSTGNEADLGIGDGIAALAELPDVRAIAVVLETVRDGAAFAAAVERAARAGKPVVVCRLGMSRHGQQLMRSHTGALAASNRVLAGVCEALGVTLTETPADMLAVAEVLAHAKRPAGSRVGIVTHSGGTAILLSDLAERHRLDLPEPSVALRATLDEYLAHGAANNPLDLGAIIGGAHRYTDVVAAFTRSGEYDLVLSVSTPHPPADTDQRVASLIELARGDLPLVDLWMVGDLGADGWRRLKEHRAACAEDAGAAVHAVAALARAAPENAGSPVSQRMQAASAPGEVVAVTEFDAKARLTEWGLPVVRGEVASGADEATAVADRLGLPVVLKAVSPELLHKTEAGGVRVDLRAPGDVRRAHDEIAASLAAAGVPLSGVLVEQFRPGLEIIVGCMRDPVFGPTVLIGLGGIDAELLDDAATAPAPVTVSGAQRLIDRLAGAAVLRRSRRRPEPDLTALAELTAHVSERFAEDPALIELEMNPIAWTTDGWIVLDALLRQVRP